MIASCTTSPPVTPPAPCTSTDSPLGADMTSLSAWSAVSAGTGNAAANLPRNRIRLAHDECGGSDQPLRPGALLTQGQRMGEHFVAWREARHLFANGDDDACRLDPENERRLAADIPGTYSDDLVPVADSGRPHRDHDLVRSERLRRRQLEHLHLAPERLDAGGAHQSAVSTRANSFSRCHAFASAGRGMTGGHGGTVPGPGGASG
jgi:hypothetical protein